MMPKCNIFYGPFSFSSFSYTLGYILYDDDVAFVVDCIRFISTAKFKEVSIKLYPLNKQQKGNVCFVKIEKIET